MRADQGKTRRTIVRRGGNSGATSTCARGEQTAQSGCDSGRGLAAYPCLARISRFGRRKRAKRSAGRSASRAIGSRASDEADTRCSALPEPGKSFDLLSESPTSKANRHPRKIMPIRCAPASRPVSSPFSRRPSHVAGAIHRGFTQPNRSLRRDGSTACKPALSPDTPRRP